MEKEAQVVDVVRQLDSVLRYRCGQSSGANWALAGQGRRPGCAHRAQCVAEGQHEVPNAEAEDGSYGPGPFLEGGDVFLLGRDIYVGVSGNASNTAGVQWLQRYLGDEYRVHEVKLTKKFLHLDCCLATPREGLAIICKEAFVGGILAFLNDWELIELPYVEAKEKLGCNGLVLDEKTIMIHTDLPLLGKALRKAGQEVIETPFDAVYDYAGAFRCWHHPLVRESTL